MDTNKRIQWAIALLLAAIVPFATGCKSVSCDDALDLIDGGNRIYDVLNPVGPVDLVSASPVQLLGNDCDGLRRTIKSVVRSSTFQSIKEDCKEHKKDNDCSLAADVKARFENLASNVATACDEIADGGRLGAPDGLYGSGGQGTDVSQRSVDLVAALTYAKADMSNIRNSARELATAAKCSAEKITERLMTPNQQRFVQSHQEPSPTQVVYVRADKGDLGTPQPGNYAPLAPYPTYPDLNDEKSSIVGGASSAQSSGGTSPPAPGTKSPPSGQAPPSNPAPTLPQPPAPTLPQPAAPSTTGCRQPSADTPVSPCGGGSQPSATTPPPFAPCGERPGSPPATGGCNRI